MTEIFTIGRWKPNAGKKDAFVGHGQTSRQPRARCPARWHALTRDVHVAQVFLSFGAWESIDAVRAWKSAPDFRERMSRMLQHVDEFEPSELALVATAEAGAASAEPSPVRLESSARGVTDQRQGCSV